MPESTEGVSDGNDFEDRNVDGTYKSLTEGILRLGDTFLGAASFKNDFYRVIPRYIPHYVYHSVKTHKPFSVNVFGEIAGPELGTLVSAIGNHSFEGVDNTFQPITDRSTIKDVVTLKVPTCAPPVLETLYDNQLATLNEMRLVDEEEENNSGRLFHIKEWVRASQPNSPEALGDIFNVHLPLKYEGTGNANVRNPAKHVKKKLVSMADIDSSKNLAQIDDVAGVVIPSADAELKVPSPEEIVIGARYDPRLLEDFEGPCFSLERNMLVQRDVRDINDQLIPPWRYYEDLRPGTVVLMTVSLHCFRYNVDGKRERKLYQLHAENIKVLATSTLPVLQRKVPSIPSQFQHTVAATSSAAQPRSDAATALNNFHKRKAEVLTDHSKADLKGKRRETDSAKQRRGGKKAASSSDVMDIE